MAQRGTAALRDWRGLAAAILVVLGVAAPLGTAGAADIAAAYARARADAASPEDLRLLALGASTGDPEAAFDLACLFESGRSLPRDPRRAFEWFWQATVSGAPGALDRLRAAYGRLDPADQARVGPDVRAVLFPSPNRGTTASSKPAPVKPGDREILGIAAEIVRATQNTRVPPALALAVATVESRFRPDAESPKGARGIMQVMPTTASAAFAVEPEALWDVRTNVTVGVHYLDRLLARYGAIRPALAHYVGGGRAVGWLEDGRSAAVSDYVSRVMDYYAFYRARGF
jgi:soluble lytic murein transglycosylase-like protein